MQMKGPQCSWTSGGQRESGPTGSEERASLDPERAAPWDGRPTVDGGAGLAGEFGEELRPGERERFAGLGRISFPRALQGFFFWVRSMSCILKVFLKRESAR